jgi:diaminopimelate decarboxylase
MGFETASLGELTQALRAVEGKEKPHIVFDSPIKTRGELKVALENGVDINLDNLQELAVLKSLFEEHPHLQSSAGQLGIRLNPQVGSGGIAALSTGSKTSKFGIGMLDYRDEIVQAYKDNAWLTMMLVHTGSQGIPFDLMAAGVRQMLDAVQLINAETNNQITTVDIGGGMPVNFSTEVQEPSFQTYREIFETLSPELFSGELKVVTEHGRRIVTKAGVLISRVEYVKEAGGRKIVLQHAGADVLLRTVYHPDTWPLRVTVCDKHGVPKSMDGPLFETDVAGPLCFQGDVIAHQRQLPEVERGDLILIHDTGGYMHSSWGYYNARQAPDCFLYRHNSLDLFKKKATVEETLAFYT